MHIRSKFTHSFLITVFLALNAPILCYSQSKSDLVTQNPTKKSNIKNIWRQEPNSFAGIGFYQKIDFPICPYSVRWKEMVEADPNLVACLVLNPRGSQDLNGNPTTEINPARDVSPLGPVHLIANEDNAIVGIKSYFIADRYTRLLAIFTERYGSPHVVRQTKLQTNGGAFFEGVVNEWNGQKVNIKLESLVKREYSTYSQTFYETGEFSIYSTSWLRSNGEALKNEAKNKAKNF